MRTYLSVAALLAALAVSVSAADLKTKKAAPLPPAVRQAVLALVGDGKLLDVERTIENGRPVFEGEYRQNGVLRSFTFTPDGMLIARQVFEQELPPAVAQTLRAQLAGATLGDIYWTNDEGNPAYYAEFTRGPEKRGVTIAPDGWLAAREVALNELPASVAQGIRKTLNGAVPTRIDRSDEGGGEVTFDVTVESGARSRTWIFSADGKLDAIELALNDTPAAAQKELLARLGTARLVHVFKFEDEGESYFEATFVKSGQHHAATAHADGTLVSEVMPLGAAPPAVQKAVRDAGGFLVKLELQHDDAGDYFEASLRRTGKLTRIELKPDGSAR